MGCRERAMGYIATRLDERAKRVLEALYVQFQGAELVS
jgi:hypothetical protein